MSKASCNLGWRTFRAVRAFLGGCPGPRRPAQPTLINVETVMRYIVNVGLAAVTDPDVDFRHFHYSLDGVDQEPLTLPANATLATFFVPAGPAKPFPTPACVCFLHDVDFAGNESVASAPLSFTVADNTAPAQPGAPTAGDVNIVPDANPQAKKK